MPKSYKDANSVNSPFTGAVAITKADADLLDPIRGILVTGPGNLVLTFVDGSVATVPVVANIVYDFMVKRVAAASTATGIIGFY